jgi:CYTH domain-containing protein
LHRRLGRRLSEYQLTLRLENPQERPPIAAAVTGSLLLDLTADLEQHLAAVHTLGDVAETHRARIAGKRLRYALEPLRRDVPEVEALVERLKGLQDALGDLHDAAVLAEAITTAMADAAAEQARRLSTAVLQPQDGPRPRPGRRRRDPRPGLLELARRLRERREKGFEAFGAGWLGGAAGGFFADVRALGQSLVDRGARGLEIERKYLLGGRPEIPPDATQMHIDQGYLPGARIAERLRRVRGPRGERWYRTVKVGSGVTRVEHEEETTAEVFKRLWPLTKGRRVRKRRHEVPAGGSVWQIDEFLDRDLVLAEIELPSADAAAEPPEWLAPYIVRDVTDEPEYQNVNLAR